MVAAMSPESHCRRRAFVALGSNLGDRWENLRLGVSLLPDVVSASAVYETEPVGGPQPQPRYLNMVVELSTSATPGELLAHAQAAETAAGRVRGERWGPRALDVDILAVGDEEVRTAELEVPHPRMWERGFVLVPLAEIAPDMVAGRLGDRWADRLGDGVVRIGELGPGRDSGRAAT